MSVKSEWHNPPPGTILRNGTTLLACRPCKEEGLNIVLAHLDNAGNAGCSNYATWKMAARDGSTFLGHYFAKISNAAKDFEER